MQGVREEAGREQRRKGGCARSDNEETGLREKANLVLIEPRSPMPLLPQIPLRSADPVCGAMVDTRLDPLELEYHGRLFYFCSAKCMQAFTGNPSNYSE